jgi:signal transduction histidine kinase
MIGMLSMLLQTQLTSEQSEYAQIAYDSAVAMLGILDDVLLISKLDKKMVGLKCSYFCLLRLLRDTHTFMAVRAKVSFHVCAGRAYLSGI